MKKVSKKLQKIAITGGKGGTGKSTFAILLANKFLKENKRVVLCDCDIECPNDYLITAQKLKKARKKFYYSFPELIKEKCQKCGLCVSHCESNAIFQAPKKYPIFIKELCSGCGACWLICPYKAIRSKKEKVGQVYTNKINQNFYLVTGEAKAGLEETGPIVRKVKNYSLELAKKIKADYILFDTAAGTHCPVIQALLDVDYAYVVTEPTPMGACDLGLILDLLKKLKIKPEVVLNQADLGRERLVEKIAQKFKTKISIKIPYSKEIAEAYARGTLLNIQPPIYKRDWKTLYKDYGTFQKKSSPRVKKAVIFFKNKKIKKALDLGCGTGRHTALLKRAVFETYGCDSSPDALKIAKKELSGVKFKKCSMTALPYRNNSFDGILCHQVIQHARLKDIKKAISEIYRVLKKEGFLFLVTISRKYPKYFTGEEIEPHTKINIEATDGATPHHYFSREELRELFRKFKIIELKHTWYSSETTKGAKAAAWILYAQKS